MKRILIVNNNMHIGGVQRALCDLLSEIHDKYEVTLLLFYRGGELLKDIPEDVNIIAPASPLRYWGMTRNDVRGFKEKAARGFWAAITRVFGRGFAFSLAGHFQKKLGGYDAAISYLHSGAPKAFYGGCNEFVLKCVEAERKLTFLHCDYEKINALSGYNTSIYERFDAVAACSKGCRDAFLRVMPQFADKTTVVRNCRNYAQMQRMVESAEVSLPRGRMNILTVARLGREKGILRAISAVEQLEKREFVNYIIIGDGEQYTAAVKMIAERGLEDTIRLLGEMENPYGYMRSADFLLIPSVSEAAPMAIGEAACLGTPVLTTATSSAEEMVADTGYGWVCENSIEGIKEGIEMLLDDPKKLSDRREYIKKAQFDNAEALAEFCALIG